MLDLKPTEKVINLFLEKLSRYINNENMFCFHLENEIRKNVYSKNDIRWKNKRK